MDEGKRYRHQLDVSPSFELPQSSEDEEEDPEEEHLVRVESQDNILYRIHPLLYKKRWTVLSSVALSSLSVLFFILGFYFLFDPVYAGSFSTGLALVIFSLLLGTPGAYYSYVLWTSFQKYNTTSYVPLE
eukprot:TRINITY_DN3926_c0_g1_i1.p1 TRINITY_DN3926_c0_g1~~TRINITY_DN3926_c0_g1_i1.p1  ORF type:complete len:151 (+),score=34.46 TRINITY_DN3926_c0_g1_i1:64-453(+)